MPKGKKEIARDEKRAAEAAEAKKRLELEEVARKAAIADAETREATAKLEAAKRALEEGKAAAAAAAEKLEANVARKEMIVEAQKKAVAEAQVRRIKMYQKLGYASAQDCAYANTGFGYLTGLWGDKKRVWQNQVRYCDSYEPIAMAIAERKVQQLEEAGKEEEAKEVKEAIEAGAMGGVGEYYDDYVMEAHPMYAKGIFGPRTTSRSAAKTKRSSGSDPFPFAVKTSKGGTSKVGKSRRVRRSVIGAM